MAEVMSDNGRRNGTQAPRRREAVGAAPNARTDTNRRRRGDAHRLNSRTTARPTVRRGVRVPELLLGVFLVAACALGAVLWHTSTTKRTPVLVLAAPVTRGHVITPDDLVSAQANAAGIALVAAERAGEFVGQVAAVDLQAGAPINADVIRPYVPLRNGESLVGRRLEPGDYPSNLAVGDTVAVVLVADPALQTAPTEGDAADSVPVSSALQADTRGIVPDTVTLSGVVESVAPLDDGTGAVVVTMRMTEVAAAATAATTDVRLVQVG